MPQASIKMFFLDDPDWPPGVPPVEPRGNRAGRIHKLNRLHGMERMMWSILLSWFTWLK